MCGMESLLRWQHPNKGLLMPDHFVPLLEETGQIVEVGEWVLTESCRLNKSWQDEGMYPLPIAVNISYMQFNRVDFVTTVKRILSSTGLLPQYLELELTESYLIEDLESSREHIRELKELGVRITLDDFGTGYSSFNYLCWMPVDSIKIDRSYVHGLDDSREKRAIITAMMSLAHSLRLDAIAEGVETESQLMFFNGLHCQIIQGYLFSKALSEEDFVKIYRAGGDFSHQLEHMRQVLSMSA